ncbi:MAG TPA: nuclear transport factor 2 family protein [Gemmatimonadales bacterium]
MLSTSQVLLAREQVIDRLNTLFISTDIRDWAAVRACFAATVHFDMTSLAGGDPVILTPEAIARAWEQGLASIESVHHQAGNYRVTLDGDEAMAFCYGIAMHYRPTRSGKNTRTFVGSYEFRLKLIGGDWRITIFRFNLKFLDGNIELEKEP